MTEKKLSPTETGLALIETINPNSNIVELSNYPNKHLYDFKTSSEHNSYFAWSSKTDELLKDENYLWENLFPDQKYFDYLNSYNGQPFPRFHAVSDRMLDILYNKEERRKRYYEHLHRLNLKDKRNVNLQDISGLKVYRDLIKERIELYETELKRIDAEINSVIKVFFHEFRKSIQNESLLDAKMKNDKISLLIDFVWIFCKVAVNKVVEPVVLKRHWFDYKEKVGLSDNPVIEKSFENGILANIPKKENVILNAVPFFEKLIHTETAIHYILNDKPLINDEEMPEFIDNNLKKSMQETVIRCAIHGLLKKNKNKAIEFMHKYAELKDKFPYYNQSDFVKEFDWPEPSSNTQKNWMERYDNAQKELYP